MLIAVNGFIELKSIICAVILGLASGTVFAEEQDNSQSGVILDSYAYYSLEPEIVTNYITSRRNLGFVRVQVELMVENESHLEPLALHDPLLRATILEIIGSKNEEQTKSLAGRDNTRAECLETLNRLLTQEVGKPLIENLLFTKYLYE